MRPKLHVRRGDLVEVIAGSARGVRGRVLRAAPREGRVVVEGAKLVWKHLRRGREHPRGGRIQVEAAMDASNVMLICTNRDCPRNDKPVRARTVVREGGKRFRACVKCGAEIAKPE